MSDVDELLAHFEEITEITSDSTIEYARLVFPKLKKSKRKLSGHRSVSDDVEDPESLLPYPNPTSSIHHLANDLTTAGRKLRYLETSIINWDRRTAFSEDNYFITENPKYIKYIPSEKNHWNPGDSVNSSKNVANDWFRNHLVPSFLQGSSTLHSQVLVGGPGCGKSTLLKYLLTKNTDLAFSNELVISRFEFRKFYYFWRIHSRDLSRTLNSYLSYIHLRDLVIAEYMEFSKEGDLIPKFKVSSPEARKATANNFVLELQNHAKEVAQNFSSKWSPRIYELIESTAGGNQSLLKAVKNLPYSLRQLLVAVLIRDRALVTIFDGMDSVKIQDSFDETPEFDDVKEIIGLRYTVTNYLDEHLGQRPLRSGTLVVMRANTSALLHGQKTKSGFRIRFEVTHFVAPLKPIVALAKATFDAADKILEFKLGEDTTERNNLVVDLLILIQRTMTAIRQSGGKANILSFDEVYGMFDGNIRELLDFFVYSIVRHYNEMAKNGGYFEDLNRHSTVVELMEDMTSKGYGFLKRKSYRIVDFLLHDENLPFENRIIMLEPGELSAMHNSNDEFELIENKNSVGRLDNVFNYFNGLTEHSAGRFSFLEKIRIIQILSDQNGGMEYIREELSKRFGIHYEKYQELRPILLIMLKTDFLQVEVGDRIGGEELKFKPTNRATLSASILIRNLAYIEHTFHQTSYPDVMVSVVNDNKREGKVFRWTISAIQNAYIFLTYLNYIENRKPRSVNVQKRDRIFSNIRNDLCNTIKRMLKDDEYPFISDANDSNYEGTELERKELATEALAAIKLVKKDWLAKGLIKDLRH